MKDSIKKLFNELQALYANNPLKEREMSHVITYLFSLFRASESSKGLLISSFRSFPDILPYAISYMENPNCTCRENIRTFIEKEPSVGVEIFLNLLENEKEDRILETLERACGSFVGNLTGDEFKLYGKIIQIENSPEEYLKTIKNYNKDPRYIYKGLQVIKTEDGKFLDLYFY